MSHDTISVLLPALGIAAFVQSADGSFQALAPAPSWFSRLGADGTFPFLGHILEEANLFWAAKADGVREWGPCADVDDNGRDFHFIVKAVSAGSHAFLVFQLDDAAERMREVLQTVRSAALERPAQGNR
jgi:hypothetical protein